MKLYYSKASSALLWLGVLLALVFVAGAEASITVIYNDTPLPLVAPLTTVDGRVMVPLESLAEPLGLIIRWNRATGELAIQAPSGDDYIGQVGEKYFVGAERTLGTGVPPTLIDDHIYVPIQAIVNMLGIRLAWDGGAKALRIMGDPPKASGAFHVEGPVPQDHEEEGPQLDPEPQLLPFDDSLGLVKQVAFARDQQGAWLEISSTRFSGLSINLLQSPARLVIDIPQSRLAVEYETIEIEDSVVRSIRMSQNQSDVVRIVVDLHWMTGYDVNWQSETKVVVALNQLVGGVSLTRRGSALTLFFESTGDLAREIKLLREPHRLVIDFHGATLCQEGIEADIEDELVSKIRLSQFQPGIVRFVMETKEPVDASRLEARPNQKGVELLLPGLRGETGWLALRQPIYDGVGALADTGWESFGNTRWEASPSESMIAEVSADLPAGSGPGIGDGDPESGPRSSPEEEDVPVGGQEALDVALTLPALDLMTPEAIQWLKQRELSPEALGGLLSGLEGKVIVIDPGHGGPEVGAAGRDGVWEKELNLAVGLQVYEGLQAAGAEVYMTRMTDNLVPLSQRSQLANERQADAFISIHFNASYSKQAAGTETLYKDSNPANAALSRALQRQLVAVLDTIDRGTKIREDLYVLRHTEVPAALVEVAFLDHAEEGPRFLDSEMQRRAAIGIIAGVYQYFSVPEGEPVETESLVTEQGESNSTDTLCTEEE